MNAVNTFPKSEHLCGEKRIARLFTQGEAFIAYPLRIVFLIAPLEDNATARLLLSVSKKRFKRAVKRNRLKRLMRESYRLNKQSLIAKLRENNLQAHIAFNYISSEIIDFATMEQKMQKSLQILIEKIDKA